MTKELFLLGDLSRRLNVPPHRISYLFVKRAIPEPEMRLGNRRVFTEEDGKAVAKALGLEWLSKKDHE